MSYLYKPFPIEPERATGISIFSKDGAQYTDTFSGIGVNAFGYSFPPLLTRLSQKMNRYIHLSNFLEDPDLPYVVENLLHWTGREGEVVFTNSGTESTEVALKALLKARNGIRNIIVYFTGGFHGRTIGSLAVMGIDKFRRPFEPLMPNTVSLPWNDKEALQRYFTDHGDQILAVILEPIQGSAGIIPIEESLANAIMEAKATIPFFLVCDEVQAGLGRSGKYFAYEHFFLKPDIVLLGKALGGGLPLGAALLLGDTAKILELGDHGSTFAPNPVALAGARFLIEKLPDLLPQIKESADYIWTLLQTLPAQKVKEIRGKGLMIGIELDKDYPKLAENALENHHLLLNVIGNKVVRLMPPLNVSKPDIDQIFKQLESVVSTL
jgi:acetylornithine/N-succinyldiaminopimelate aminotransferase